MAGVSRKDLERIIKALEAQGATIVLKRNGVMIQFEDGSSTTFHWTTSDDRAIKNMRAVVRRAGLVWPFDNRRALKELKKLQRPENES